ncbi:MAG: hypothetical protein IKH26_09325 [Bacteroidaceae bacterium]|nr:hypothetical protein [Bacteroidaceae bacterium]
MKRILTAIVLAALMLNEVSAQVAYPFSDVEYAVEMSGTLTNGDYPPFWLSSNKYGLSSEEEKTGYLRVGVFRPIETDSEYLWRIGYGADIAIPVNYTSPFVVQQLYADFEYKKVRLSIGSKERGMELKNALLSSGGQTTGINARPVPQVRIELPEYWTIPNTGGWLAVKGHLAYGRFTDDSWQKDFINAPDKQKYTSGVLYHSKAGYLRIGNDNLFPLSFTGGLEMKTQFGGKMWNVGRRLDDTSDFSGNYVKGDTGIRGFLNAFVPGGSDARDGDYKNVEGNHLGSWVFSLDYQGQDWSVRSYLDHFFDDHSQMFVQYGWKDMLLGFEAKLPDNPLVTNVVVEYLNTKDQTGPLYHDGTSTLPDQISGRDDYFNHAMYTGWQHWGQSMGNPLIISPIYNSSTEIRFEHNRVKGHHIALAGNPTSELSYRLMYTHVKSWGTYLLPLIDTQQADFFFAELSYSPHRLKGWNAKVAFGTNSGNLLGKSSGATISIVKRGFLTKKPTDCNCNMQ